MQSVNDLRKSWDERYSMTQASELFTANPNEFLVQHAQRIKENSSVLCIADGQGRNSRWLSRQGHSVTSVDISPVAVADATRLSQEAGMSVSHHCADLDQWIQCEAARGPWDAIIAISSYWPLDQARQRVHRFLGEHLRPGGVVILEVSAAVTTQELIKGEWGPHLQWQFSERISNENRQIGGVAVKSPALLGGWNIG